MLQILEYDLNDDLIRLAAYDLLIRLDIHSLPVNVMRLFDTDSSVCYNTIQNLASHVHIPVENIISPESAGLIYRIPQEIDYIYINIEYPFPQILWNISLAIGALELDAVPYRTYCEIPQNNRSVTSFVYYLLAPDIILKACGFSSQAEVFQYCKLPFRESVKKARKIKLHFMQRMKSIGAEKIVLSNFQPYIDKIRILKE